MAEFIITEGLECLGALKKGGQGSLLKGRRIDGTITAIKLLPTPIFNNDESNKHYRDFTNEVKKLKRVNEKPNPNVVKILSYGLSKSSPYPYIEMEFIEGSDLEELLKPPHDSIFSIKETIKLAEQLSNALAHCHRLDVKHGDIKSNNVKFNKNTGNYVLLDFGLAVLSDEQRRTSLRDAGAIEFMAPEQSEGHLLFQTDIYGFGIILFELLAGQVPFPLKDNNDTARHMVRLAHLNNELPKLTELRRQNLPENWSNEQKEEEMQIPEWLIFLVEKCLKKKPEERFANGIELEEWIIQQIEEEKESTNLEKLYSECLSEIIAAKKLVEVIKKLKEETKNEEEEKKLAEIENLNNKNLLKGSELLEKVNKLKEKESSKLNKPHDELLLNEKGKSNLNDRIEKPVIIKKKRKSSTEQILTSPFKEKKTDAKFSGANKPNNNLNSDKEIIKNYRKKISLRIILISAFTILLTFLFYKLLDSNSLTLAGSNFEVWIKDFLFGGLIKVLYYPLFSLSLVIKLAKVCKLVTYDVLGVSINIKDEMTDYFVLRLLVLLVLLSVLIVMIGNFFILQKLLAPNMVSIGNLMQEKLGLGLLIIAISLLPSVVLFSAFRYFWESLSSLFIPLELPEYSSLKKLRRNL